MTTLTPPSGQAFTAVVKYTPATDIYQTDARLPVVAVAPGATKEMTSGLFAGAKVWSILRDYQDEKPIKGFVDAIDWGWFFFLTKPIFRVLHEMHKLIGNMGRGDHRAHLRHQAASCSRWPTSPTSRCRR